MKILLKILNISLVVLGVNFLAAAAVSDFLGDAEVDSIRKEQVTRVCSILDGLVSESTTQFLADCVPVGVAGQPTDRSYDAFKVAVANAIMTREFPAFANTKESIESFRKSLTIVALDDFVGGNLKRCADEMLHSSVTISDHTSIGFLNYVYQSAVESSILAHSSEMSLGIGEE